MRHVIVNVLGLAVLAIYVMLVELFKRPDHESVQ